MGDGETFHLLSLQTSPTETLVSVQRWGEAGDAPHCWLIKCSFQGSWWSVCLYTILSLAFPLFPKSHILINLQALAEALKEPNWPAGIETHNSQKRLHLGCFHSEDL